MRRYIEACQDHATTREIASVLDQIIPDAGVHARFVNTLARMEYVGVRKLLKSRRAERLDLDGLQHMLDENVHALRLKKAAVALAATVGADVSTFADDHTLAGGAGEGYLQALDHRAEAALSDLPADGRTEANYLLTTAAIEVRAQVFYPLYDQRLAAHRVGFSVAAISKDEDRHLAEMVAGLETTFGDWRARFDPLMAAEQRLFDAFWAQLRDVAARARARAA
ncbi:MAG: hypothetical protein ABUR63_03370 [Verrucomicrobiota bacterium]